MFQWYCCLNPVEAGAAAAMLEWFVSFPLVGMPLPLFEALFPVGTRSRLKRRDAFLECYQLQEDICTDPEGDPYECITYTDLIWWGQFVAFWLSEAGDCPDGCTQPSW